MTPDTDREKLRAEHQHAKGPGKYEANRFPLAASYIHDITLNGGHDRETGTNEYGSGWHAFVQLDVTMQRDVSYLMDEDHALGVEAPIAAILHEDDRGFVTLTLYINEEEAEREFSKFETEYANIDALYEEDE